MIKLKRVCLASAESDGFRILVDRMWPRGLSKDRAKLDLWLKAISPSTKWRKSFKDIPERIVAFSDEYQEELATDKEKCEAVEELVVLYQKYAIITLVYSAKNKQQNQAVLLKEYIERRVGT